MNEKLISAIVGVLVILLSAAVPELKVHLDAIAPSVVAIVAILVGSKTAIDWKEASTQEEVTKAQAYIDVAQAEASWKKRPYGE